MKNLYIAGAGGCGRETLSLALDIKRLVQPDWEIRGFLDDTENPLGDAACDYGVVASIKDFSPKRDDLVVVALADPHDKYDVVNFLRAKGASFTSLIHPYATLGRFFAIGDGVIIQSGFAMTVNVNIGSFSLMLASLLGHDVKIGDFSTISSHCNISGHVNVGERTFIGGNVAIAPNITIGDDAYLCMGSVILKDVPAGAKMLGNPARVIG